VLVNVPPEIPVLVIRQNPFTPAFVNKTGLSNKGNPAVPGFVGTNSAR